MDDGVFLEDVDLLDARDGVDSKPLERVLQALVIRGGRLVHRLFLPVVCAGVCRRVYAGSDTHRRIVPLPPVRTAPAIFISLSRLIWAEVVLRCCS